MQKRARYFPPRTVTFELGNKVLPAEVFNAAQLLERHVNPQPGTRVKHQFSTIVDSDRKFVEVSNSFCQILGYSRQELVGKRYDEFTAPDTTDIATVYCLFARTGYMHGVWVFRDRAGENVLVQYEAWIRADAKIQSVMELIP